MHPLVVLRDLDLSTLLVAIWVSLGILTVWLPRRERDHVTRDEADAYNLLRGL